MPNIPPDPVRVKVHQASGHPPLEPWCLQCLLPCTNSSREANYVEARDGLQIYMADLTRVDCTADMVSWTVWASTPMIADKPAQKVLHIAAPGKGSDPLSGYMVKSLVELIKRMSHLEAELRTDSDPAIIALDAEIKSLAMKAAVKLVLGPRGGAVRSPWVPPGRPRTCASGRRGPSAQTSRRYRRR